MGLSFCHGYRPPGNGLMAIADQKRRENSDGQQTRRKNKGVSEGGNGCLLVNPKSKQDLSLGNGFSRRMAGADQHFLHRLLSAIERRRIGVVELLQVMGIMKKLAPLERGP